MQMKFSTRNNPFINARVIVVPVVLVVVVDLVVIVVFVLKWNFSMR